MAKNLLLSSSHDIFLTLAHHHELAMAGLRVTSGDGNQKTPLVTQQLTKVREPLVSEIRYQILNEALASNEVPSNSQLARLFSTYGLQDGPRVVQVIDEVTADIFAALKEGKIRLITDAGDHGKELQPEWPQIWRHDARTILDLVKVARDSLHQYRTRILTTHGNRDIFVGVAVTGNAPSKAHRYLAARATTIIDALLSLECNAAWATMAAWLRGKAERDLPGEAAALFEFAGAKEGELQLMHSRALPSDLCELAGLVWDFLQFADRRWSGELDYVVRNVELAMPHLKEPEPAAWHSIKDGKEHRDGVKFEQNHHRSDSVQAPAPQCRLLPLGRARARRHFQLPTRASILRAKAIQEEHSGVLSYRHVI